MLQIYYTINSIRRRFFSDKSEEFKKGFQTCLDLFDFGMSKHPQFNANIKCDELEADCKELRKQIKDKDKALQQLRAKASLNAIVAVGPVSYFKVYKVVALDTKEEFSIIVNMDKETWNNMAINFAGRYSWKTVEECKAMMLQFINSKHHLGFKAYKDEKTALKDRVKIKR